MSAVILPLPAKVQRQAKRRINRVDLEARHRWMMKNMGKWGTDATDGAEYETNINVVRLKAIMRERWPEEYGVLTMVRMRRDIAEGRKLIEKRNRVKAWLASMGADLDDIKDAEQALFAAFDRLA